MEEMEAPPCTCNGCRAEVRYVYQRGPILRGPLDGGFGDPALDMGVDAGQNVAALEQAFDAVVAR